jgi:chaperonin GroES
MIITPVHDNVIVKIKKQEANQTTAGGIIIPKTSNAEKQDTGKVIAVGSGRILNSGEHIPMSVTEGDTIIFNKFAGTEIESGDDLYLIIKENDILAIIKE